MKPKEEDNRSKRARSRGGSGYGGCQVWAGVEWNGTNVLRLN